MKIWLVMMTRPVFWFVHLPVFTHFSSFWSRNVVKRGTCCRKVCPSVCLFVCLPHTWFTPKRFKMWRNMLRTVRERDVSCFLRPNFVNPNLGAQPERVHYTETPLANTQNLTNNPRYLETVRVRTKVSTCILTHRKSHLGFDWYRNCWP